jgi:hypothetical protein
MTVTGPSSDDLRCCIDDTLHALGALPDDAWDVRAHELDWDCRDTAGHLLDDFGGYAMQLSGQNPPRDAYVAVTEPPIWREASPQILFWPDPAGGTAAIVECVDALGGLLCAVVATAPDDRRGFHPWGLSDAGGFAAMGIVECVLHTWDVLTAHGIGYRGDSGSCSRALDRLFPLAVRSEDPWQDLLLATGRVPPTAGLAWTWDSSVNS